MQWDRSRRNHSPAGEVLVAYLTEQRDQLRDADRRVRADEPEGVHDLRVATRRARSMIATSRRLLLAGEVGQLIGELRWVGQALGESRDAEVLRDRLLADVAQLSGAGVRAASVAIDAALQATARAGRAEVVEKMDSDRYATAIAALDAFLADPPFAVEAGRPAQEVLPTLLRHDRRRVARRTRVARRCRPGPARDAALHSVRKAAKRLRYASEASAPVAPKRGARLVDASTALHDTLGLHQDAVVAMAFLAGLAGGDVDTEVAFVLGQLDAREQRRAAEAERDFFSAWRHFPKVRPSRWR